VGALGGANRTDVCLCGEGGRFDERSTVGPGSFESFWGLCAGCAIHSLHKFRKELVATHFCGANILGSPPSTGG
jgi:hypothetical protein